MSWHTPGPSVGVKARSHDTASCHAPGPVVWTEGSPPALPLCPSSSEPRLTTCGLCPEPGLVPASTLSNHLLEVHQGEAFECAACKVCGISVVSVNFAGIKDHVRKVHKIQESMVTSAVICPIIPSLAAFICANCNNNEDSRIWFSESDVYQHIDNIHGQFFRKKLLAATCRLCDRRGSLAEIQSHVVQCRKKIEFENEVSEEETKQPTLLNNLKVSIRKDIYKNSNMTANVIKKIHENTESTENVIVRKKIKRNSTEEKSLDGELESSKQIQHENTESTEDVIVRKKIKRNSTEEKSLDGELESSKQIQKPKMMKMSVRSSSCSSSGFSSSDSPRKGRRSKKNFKRNGTPSPRRESTSKSSQDRHSSSMSHSAKHILLSSRSESRSENISQTRGTMFRLSENSHRYTRGSRSRSPGNNSGYYIQGTLSPLYRSPPRGYRGRSPPRYRSRSPHHHQPFSPFDLRHSIRHKQTVPRNPLHDKNRNRIVSRGQHYIKYENGESQCNICGEISPNQIQYKGHLSNEKHRKAVKQIANEVLRKHGGRSRSEDRSVNDPENNLHPVGKVHASILEKEAKISGKFAPAPIVVKAAQFGKSCPKCHKPLITDAHFHCEICKICCRSPLLFEQHIAGKFHAENVQEKSKGRGEPLTNCEASVSPITGSSPIPQSIASSQPTSDLQCHGCDQRFGSISALKRHIHHEHGFIIKCSDCEAKGQTPAEVLTCKALIGHYLKAHNKAIEDYDLNLYGTVNNWKQGYVRCKLCTMRLGGPGLWFTNSLDKAVIRTHFKTYHDNIASNVTPLSQIVLGCQLCTISDFSSSSTFSWQTHLATHTKRNTDTVSEESTSQTESTGASSLVTGPCFYCGDKVVKSGNAEKVHVRNMHFELSFRCKMCKGKQTCYEKLEDVEEHLEKRHGWHSGHGKIKAVDMPGKKGDLLGLAWVRCKRLGCGFTRLGLRSETLGHQAKAHNGGGIKSFNIFCRICAGIKKVDRSTEVFDDASDFIAHMRQRHQELVELLSDS